jgi:hypothetical protein
MRYGTAAVLLVGALGACATTDESDSCNRTDDVEEALHSLDDVIDDKTDANNVDEKLEQLGNDVNEVMNTTDDDNALQISNLELSYDDLKQQLENLGNADDLSETGEELNATLDQLGDAIHRMSDATEEKCTP